MDTTFEATKPLIMFRRFIFFIALLMLFSVREGKSQFTSVDSAFLSSVFTETPYLNDGLFPGNWYVHDSFSSIINFFSMMDSIFKFNRTDWNHAYQQIELHDMVYDTTRNNTFNYYYQNFGNAYQQYDPLMMQRFTLNGKVQNAYCTYVPGTNSQDCKTAYLIIPGSDNNQTSQIMLGNGYHNNNCYVKNQLRQSGDVYVLCKPLEDYRAVRWNGFKLNSADYSTPGPSSYMYNYLLAQGKPYAVNYLIESLALLKMMKSKYDRVIVSGCSLGGYSALLAGLESPVDGVICSSGFSVLFESTPWVQQELFQNVDSLVYQYTTSVVKTKIDQSPSKKFLFSFADGDNYIYQLEHDSLYLKNLFAANSNCSFYTNFTTHSFPPCAVFSTFYDSLMAQPSVRFKKVNETSTVCSSRVKICPGANFNFYLVRNGAIQNSFFNVQDSVDINLYVPGVYTLTGITSSSNVLSCLDTLVYNPLNPTNELFESIDELNQIVVTSPASNYIQIHATIPERIQCSVYTVFGSCIYQGNIQANDRISCSSWTNGLYLLQFKYGKNQLHKKVVVQHDF